MHATLRFIAGPNRGTDYVLEPGEYIIGRHPSSEVYAPDAGVSRQHSRIWWEAGDWFIEDLGSQNGTFVNGQRIRRHKLHDSDVVWVSSFRIQVTLSPRITDFGHVTVTDMNPPIYLADELVEAEEDRSIDPDTLSPRKLAGVRAILEAAAKTRDPDALLTEIVAKLLDVFPNADSVGVLVEDEAGELKVRCRQDRNKSFGQDLTVPATLIAHVVRDQRGILLGDAGEELGRKQTPPVLPSGSRMGAPLQAHGVSYGVLYVNCSDTGFSRDDVNLLTSIAANAGLALHSARLHQELVERQRLERDIRLARQIQRSLLPEAPPDVVGLDISAHYEAAYQIGGDFYDFIWHDRDQLAFVVGDVSGKSISAALYMARLTGELRSRTGIASTPRRLLRQVNQALLSIGEDGMFATLIYALYDFGSRTLLFSNAGHMPPLLRRKDSVSIVSADTAHAPPLGILPELDIGEASIQLEPGDLLVLSTDGIHEARSANGEEYGEKRLAACMARSSGSARDIVEAILADVASHTDDALQRDDVTVVAIQVGAKPARRRSETEIDETMPTPARTKRAT